jgi:hypothetical protein
MCLPIAAANFLATIIVFRCATELSAYYLIKRIGWSITKHFLASTIGSAPDWCLWLFILQVCVHTISYCWISLCKTRNHVACLIVEHCNVLVESILILSIYPVVFIGMLQYLWWAALQLAFQSFKLGSSVSAWIWVLLVNISYWEPCLSCLIPFHISYKFHGHVSGCVKCHFLSGGYLSVPFVDGRRYVVSGKRDGW